MKRVKVFPIIQTITNNDTEFVLTYTRDDEEFTIVDSDILKNYFINFADWYLLKPDDDQRTDKQYFTDIWSNYLRAKENNFNFSNIARCCRNCYGSKSYKGYIWRYKEDSK